MILLKEYFAKPGHTKQRFSFKATETPEKLKLNKRLLSVLQKMLKSRGLGALRDVTKVEDLEPTLIDKVASTIMKVVGKFVSAESRYQKLKAVGVRTNRINKHLYAKVEGDKRGTWKEGKTEIDKVADLIDRDRKKEKYKKSREDAPDPLAFSNPLKKAHEYIKGLDAINRDRRENIKAAALQTKQELKDDVWKKRRKFDKMAVDASSEYILRSLNQSFLFVPDVFFLDFLLLLDVVAQNNQGMFSILNYEKKDEAIKEAKQVWWDTIVMYERSHPKEAVPITREHFDVCVEMFFRYVHTRNLKQFLNYFDKIITIDDKIFSPKGL